MRLILALALALTVAAVGVANAEDGVNARTAYVERRGLIEADAQCRLLPASTRGALEVGAMQARGSLLRAGWTSAQARELETTVVSAARARPCTDERTAVAAAQARASFGQWANAGTMQFPGWQRAWVARRANEGWRLRQDVDTLNRATFGVRQVRNGAQSLVLTLALARGEAAPASASLALRDVSRARAPEISLTQRIASGLAAGLPTPSASRSVPSTRTLERGDNGGQLAVFAFPDSAFASLVTLDPRESVELRVQRGRTMQTLLVEVGDIAAARAFLTLQR